jgi:hypothetical protein
VQLLPQNCCICICWQRHYLATTVVQLLLLWSLPSNGSTCHNMVLWLQQQPRKYFAEWTKHAFHHWDACFIPTGTICNRLCSFPHNNHQMGFIWTIHILPTPWLKDEWRYSWVIIRTAGVKTPKISKLPWQINQWINSHKMNIQHLKFLLMHKKCQENS